MKEVDIVKKLCEINDVNIWKIGLVIKDEFNIEGCISTAVDELRKKYEGVLPGIMK